jgi:hypothetical protein
MSEDTLRTWRAGLGGDRERLKGDAVLKNFSIEAVP